jgi:hypothetical protein
LPRIPLGLFDRFLLIRFPRITKNCFTCSLKYG